jgi:mono/diheme cytochrome c family protein
MQKSHLSVRLFFAIVLIPFAARTANAADDLVQFNRDVRPILSDKCFFCHGPDRAQLKGDLTLIDRDAAVEAGAITPGKPDESEMIRRILSTDPDEQMPPASAKLGRLSDQEIATLKKWVEQGAEYEGHWSFIPLNANVLAGASTRAEVSQRIDEVVMAGLKARGLTLQSEADRNTLIRRLSFDLTGLPPTTDELDAFLADTSPDAIEKLVDRLLASLHYGERMAVDWLDASRYADSYGFQVDRERAMWPWRDWVIKSFNQNLPFDQFITWQLAGDLLPNATDDQILATAFNRLHQQESEGGSVEEEYRVEYVCDRVQTFATTFLGLTFECARCHDHKFDPITQKEYYQFFSMFQNIDEAGLYSYFTMSPPTPAHTLADASAKDRLQQLNDAVTAIENSSEKLRSARKAAFERWLNAADRQQAGFPLPELGRFSFETLEGDKLANSIAPDKPAVLKGENKLVPGQNGNAVEFTGDDPVDLPFGNFRREEPFTIALWLKTPDVKDRAVVFHRSRAWTDAASRGYELLIEDGRLKWSLIHFWPGNAASIRTTQPVPINEWTHVAVTSDGSSRANGLQLWINGKPAQTEIIRDALTREITGGGGDNIALAERFRDRGFTGGQIDEFRVFSRRLTSLEIQSLHQEVTALEMLRRPADQLEESQRSLLFEQFLASDAEWQNHLTALLNARTELAKFNDGLQEIMVMRELPEPKKAYVLFRGEYAQRRDEVTAGTPAALSPFPEGAPKNRLGLAQWLTDPGHPLTARVTVNRVWQSLWGRGLVKTAEDFGSQGTRPLYPEVLDALALHLIQSGWDMKQLVKTIVLSRTYRQYSLADEKTMADDPDNELLARGPRFRLTAEMIRDNALMAAGLLNPTTGGAPVNPYEMSEAFKPADPSAGDSVYRRSLYTNWRRTGPPPAMLAFDAPRRAVCIAKRERTDSPLQALILLNGIQYLEAARVLGETLHRNTGGNVPQMIEQGCLRCLSRKPDAREQEILRNLCAEQKAHFTAHPEDADELLKIGQKPRDETIPAIDAATATVLAQALLNHHDAVVKQ